MLRCTFYADIHLLLCPCSSSPVQASAIPCQVSFQAGQERRVYFAVKGTAIEQLSALGPDAEALMLSSEDAGPGATAGSGSEGSSTGSAGPASTLDAARIEIMHSSPGIVLAEPAPTRLHAGIVLSIAPLMGSQPFVDTNVGRWLHVHVRPSVRGLLRLVRQATGRKGGLLYSVKNLADGHWVLAFQDAERARNAVMMVQEQVERLQSMYKVLAGQAVNKLVAPLLI